MIDKYTGFNSLQTGKRITRCPLCRRAVSHVRVSIPFKRESGSQVAQARRLSRARSWLFQFPSNGKADHKRWERTHTRDYEHTVSIPFKRESGSQGYGIRRTKTAHPHGVSIPFKRESGSQVLRAGIEASAAYGFNSLQTGKRITSTCIRLSSSALARFQFPSNGKADHKRSTFVGCKSRQDSFQFPSNGKADHKPY